jgi:transcriptional regulator with XRE-family HTH domain
MTVGEWITEERQARGWSRDTLAFRCHISARLLAKYETGKIQPGAVNLEKLAEAFDVPLPWQDQATARYLGRPFWTMPDEADGLTAAVG